MTHTIGGKHLIDGRWQGLSGKTFSATNPATGEVLPGEFAEAGSAEIDAAMRAADTAFKAAAELDPRWPAAFLEQIAERIMDLGDALLERGELETALPRARLIGERARTCGQIKMFAGIVREGSWVDAVIDLADSKSRARA